MNWTKRISVAIALSVLTVTVGVAPAAAAPLQDYGATYSCRYRTIEGTSPAMGDLRRIVVTPPIMFADEYEQTLGWRLIVRRYLRDFETDETKVTNWKSNLKTVVGYQGEQAVLPRIVYAPPDLPAPSRWDHSYFIATMRLMWYAQDGSVQRTILHEFRSSYTYVDGELWWHTWDPSCSEPRQLEFVDGPFSR
jgi:hypothetical protein